MQYILLVNGLNALRKKILVSLFGESTQTADTNHSIKLKRQIKHMLHISFSEKNIVISTMKNKQTMIGYMTC